MVPVTKRSHMQMETRLRPYIKTCQYSPHEPKWTNRLPGIPAQPSDCLKSVLWKEDKKPQIWSESPWESKSTVLGIIGSKQYSQLMDGFLGHWTWDQCNMWVQTPLIRRTAITVASTWAKRQRFDSRSKNEAWQTEKIDLSSKTESVL